MKNKKRAITIVVLSTTVLLVLALAFVATRNLRNKIARPASSVPSHCTEEKITKKAPTDYTYRLAGLTVKMPDDWTYSLEDLTVTTGSKNKLIVLAKDDLNILIEEFNNLSQTTQKELLDETQPYVTLPLTEDYSFFGQLEGISLYIDKWPMERTENGKKIYNIYGEVSKGWITYHLPILVKNPSTDYINIQISLPFNLDDNELIQKLEGAKGIILSLSRYQPPNKSHNDQESIDNVLGRPLSAHDINYSFTAPDGWEMVKLFKDEKSYFTRNKFRVCGKNVSIEIEDLFYTEEWKKANRNNLAQVDKREVVPIDNRIVHIGKIDDNTIFRDVEPYKVTNGYAYYQIYSQLSKDNVTYELPIFGHAEDPDRLSIEIKMSVYLEEDEVQEALKDAVKVLLSMSTATN